MELMDDLRVTEKINSTAMYCKLEKFNGNLKEKLCLVASN